MQKEFISLLNSLNKKLQPIFSNYLKEEQISNILEFEADKKVEILKLVKDNDVILISANSAKKKLKNMGIDPRRLIITGGPIDVEDYILINPNLSDDAIQGIRSKCERLNKQMQNINWDNKELIFIYERENNTDKLILRRFDQISNIIGKKPILIELSTWNELDK